MYENLKAAASGAATVPARAELAGDGYANPVAGQQARPLIASCLQTHK